MLHDQKRTVVPVTLVIVGGTLLIAASYGVLGKRALAAGGYDAPYADRFESPVTLEQIPGTKRKRVTLTKRASERIGLTIAEISNRSVGRSYVMPGVISSAERGMLVGGAPGAGEPGVQKAAATGPESSRLVRVVFSGPVDRVDVSKPARVSFIGTGGTEMIAEAVYRQTPDSEEAKARTAKGIASHELVYELAGTETDTFAPGTRVRVELPRSSEEELRKIIPYSSLFYDAYGKTWVYVQEGDLTFARESVEVDFIEGKLAILKSGPDVGTRIVENGVMLLWGSELGK